MSNKSSSLLSLSIGSFSSNSGSCIQISQFIKMIIYNHIIGRVPHLPVKAIGIQIMIEVDNTK